MSGQHHRVVTAGAQAAGAFGKVTEIDVKRLRESKGYFWDYTNLVSVQIVPLWSDKNWDKKTTAVTRETYYGVKELGKGDLASQSRPAVREEDELRNPTEYARRFGLLPARRGGVVAASRDAWGHSGLTPTNPLFQTSAQRPEDDAYDESLQTIFFENTSAELVAQGAYSPRLSIPWPPDLDEPVCPYFARDRWDHAAWPQPSSGWPGMWDVRYGELINGTAGVYNAGTNQAVWDAIEPALRLASMIIRSNHPYWMAITSIFHLRPVPDAKDGRTPQQRADQGGVPYASVWLNDDEDDPRVPEPYPAMAQLKNEGFDSASSRFVCEEILLQYLHFRISNEDTYHACTTYWGDFNLLIVLNASLIWPLLMTQHISASEKAAYTFAIATTILHELAHACAFIHLNLTCRPHLILGSAFGVRVTPLMWDSLQQLGEEIWGPTRISSRGYLKRPTPRQEFFMEDEAQGEDGLNFEQQLWGGLVAQHYPFSRGSHGLMPLLTMRPWPGQHSQPLQQGRTELDQRDTAYNRFLTDPRAPSWRPQLSLPVEWYARVFQKAWWETSFQKYSHQGLKMTTSDPALPTSLLHNHLVDSVITDDSDIQAVVFGEQAWTWLISFGLPLVEAKDMFIVGFWLRALISQASASRVFGLRFASDMKAWPTKYAPMLRAAQGVSDDYQTMATMINDRIGPGAAPFDADSAGGTIQEMNQSIRRVLGPMMEVSRLMGQDVSYQQYIVTQYLQLNTATRTTFFNDMQELVTMTATNVNILTGAAPGIPLQFAMVTPEADGGWASMLEEKVFVDFVGGFVRGVVGDEISADVEAQSRLFIELVGEINSLHHSFQTHLALIGEMNALIQGVTTAGRVPDLADWPRLQSFALIRRQQSVGAYQAAALRELSELGERSLVVVITEMLDMLATKLEPTALDPARLAIQSALERREARQNEVVSEWGLFLRNEKELVRRRAAARRVLPAGVADDASAEELLGRMKAMANGNWDDERLLGVMYSLDSLGQIMASWL